MTRHPHDDERRRPSLAAQLEGADLFADADVRPAGEPVIMPDGRHTTMEAEAGRLVSSAGAGPTDADLIAAHARDVERLVPIAQELATKAGRGGITVADVRLTAVQRGILTGEETGRTLSYLAAVMKRAGLEPTASYRRSHVDRSHGNLQRVWIAP